MLYETLSQPKTFVILFLIGFLSGGIFDIFALLNYFFNKSKITRQIFIFLGTVLSFLIFSESNLTFNYGNMRFFPFFTFFGALLIERLSIGKILAKFMDKCYNFLCKIIKGLKTKLHGRKKKEKNH